MSFTKYFPLNPYRYPNRVRNSKSPKKTRPRKKRKYKKILLGKILSLRCKISKLEMEKEELLEIIDMLRGGE